MERKNKKIEGGKKREKKKKRHTEGGKKAGTFFLLSVKNKWEILKLAFNTISCLMKHNNLSY